MTSCWRPGPPSRPASAAAALTNVNQSAAGANSTNAQIAQATSVNTLNQSYPGNQTSIYPTQSPNQAADYPQQTRFTNIDQILVRANTAEEIPTAVHQVSALLHDRHHIKPDQPDDFSVRDMTEMSKALGSTTETMTRSLLFVALESLVVGGVGIMNIRLVSVPERTR